MASANDVITVLSGVSATVEITNLGPFTAPVAPGTVVANIIVTPSNWNGTLALVQAPSAPFVLNPGNGGYAGYLAVGATPLVAGSNDVTVTSTP